MILLSDIKKLKNNSALKKFIDTEYQGNNDKFISEVNSSINKLLLTDLKKTKEYIQEVRQLFKNLPHRILPRLIAMEARYFHWSGEHVVALKKYKSSIELSRSNRDFTSAAKTGQGLMDVYMYLGKYDDALETGKKSLRFFRRKGDQYTVAKIMTNIGNIYHRMDKNRSALQYYDKARHIFKKDGGVPLAIVDGNRANVFANMNQLDIASKLYLSAAKVYSENGMSIQEARQTYSLAYLYFLSDDYTRALTTFEQVYEKFNNLGDIKAAAVTVLDLVEINIQLNQYSTAISLGESIEHEFSKQGMRYEQAKTCYFKAVARHKAGDHSLALTELNRAKRLFSKEGNILWLGMINMLKASLYLQVRKYSFALKATSKARELFIRSGDKRRLLDAEIIVTEILFTSGKDSLALKKCKALLKRKLISYQGYQLYELLGNYYFKREEYNIALHNYEKAVKKVESMLSGLFPDEIKFFFALDKQKTYQSVVNCLLKLNQIHKSFYYNLKILTDINQKHISIKTLREKVPDKLLSTHNQLRASLRKLEKIPSSSQRTTGSISTFVQQEHKLWTNERRIRSYLYTDTNTNIKPSISQIREDLNKFIHPDETLINFVQFDNAIGAYCTTSSEIKYVSIDINKDKLVTLIRELHFILEKTVYDRSAWSSSEEVINYYLHEIYNELLHPLMKYIKWKKLIFIIDGLFAQIPFMALRDSDGNFIKDNFDIRLIANPLDLISRNKKFKIPRNNSGSIFTVTSSNLPSVEIEGNIIHNTFKTSRLFTGADADGATLKSRLSGTDKFVHIATHASRSSENPLFSRILMSDGPFFPFDLFRTGIKVPLISLSGCQTAAPGLHYGNSFSLAKAFNQAGAKYVLASLWSVSDKLSMTFMIEFYKALCENNDIFNAYKYAIDKMTDITKNPAYWSPFILIGM